VRDAESTDRNVVFMNRMRARFLAVVVALSWLAACVGGQPASSMDEELRSFSVSCLKQGYALNTDEHTACVLALKKKDDETRQQVEAATGKTKSTDSESLGN